jgi:hypothetical protein
VIKLHGLISEVDRTAVVIFSHYESLFPVHGPEGKIMVKLTTLSATQAA